MFAALNLRGFQLLLLSQLLACITCTCPCPCHFPNTGGTNETQQGRMGYDVPTPLQLTHRLVCRPCLQ